MCDDSWDCRVCLWRGSCCTWRHGAFTREAPFSWGCSTRWRSSSPSRPPPSSLGKSSTLGGNRSSRIYRLSFFLHICMHGDLECYAAFWGELLWLQAFAVFCGERAKRGGMIWWLQMLRLRRIATQKLKLQRVKAQMFELIKIMFLIELGSKILILAYCKIV